MRDYYLYLSLNSRDRLQFIDIYIYSLCILAIDLSWTEERYIHSLCGEGRRVNYILVVVTNINVMIIYVYIYVYQLNVLSVIDQRRQYGPLFNF
jgi:hypothetical protein